MATTKVNIEAGIPESVDVTNPQELQHAIETILMVLRAWNGDLTPEQRVALAKELPPAP